jgi:hypothetical protein
MGGFFTAAGWAGVAAGAAFMVADGKSDSPFGPTEVSEIAPRGPVIAATGSVLLVMGLSLALPPDGSAVPVIVVPAGAGVLVTGRF